MMHDSILIQSVQCLEQVVAQFQPRRRILSDIHIYGIKLLGIFKTLKNYILLSRLVPGTDSDLSSSPSPNCWEEIRKQPKDALVDPWNK